MSERRTISYSPFARIEGDLRIELDIVEQVVESARAAGTLYRGFEQLLRGRDACDGMVLTPRICGQCSLSHSAAAAAALHSLAPEEIPPNAYLTRNVAMGIELVISGITHFYMSFAPDLLAASPDDPDLLRFGVPGGSSFRASMIARRKMLPLLGILAGKWPNSLFLQPGGSTRSLDSSEISRSLGLLLELADFFESQVLGDSLGSWLALKREADLLAWLDAAAHASSDLGVFAAAALRRGLDRIGRWQASFISSGGWSTAAKGHWLEPGFHDGARHPLELDKIEECIAHSWFDAQDDCLHPSRGRTQPEAGRAEAYSWSKAPRYGSRPAEAGSLARMICDGDPLISDVLAKRGASVYTRMLARLHEMVRVVHQLGHWLRRIDPDEPFYRPIELPDSGEGAGIVEAPRGTLGHWIRIAQGKIRDYQIIPPTTWNCSPRDAADLPGPVEQALRDTPVADADKPLGVSHVVKSFDPCMYCTVH
ncbi:MAG: nickel-dependent hydrogenase large subunit [Deltaproteobacteria bacterium]|nr:nickel-dependent hydrogenase large subunit [Deltaproteobacteria bacterium]